MSMLIFMPRFTCQLPADPYIIVHSQSCFLLCIVYQGNIFVSTVNYDNVLVTIMFRAVLYYVGRIKARHFVAHKHV